MEKGLEKLLTSMDELHQKLENINETLQQFELRLSHLEKMDSIEHRVSVNQIDLTDIKEIVEKVADFQREELLGLSHYVKKNLQANQYQDELKLIHKRLDYQLNKISKTEEAVLIYSHPNKVGEL